MNLRFDKKISKVLRRLKMRPLLLAAAAVKSDSEMIGSLRAALGRGTGPVEAVVDPGAPGLEPGLYLFGHDALEVAKVGLKVARSYAAER